MLKRTLRDLKVPLVVAYTDTPAVVDDAQRTALDCFVPPKQRAYVNMGEDNLDVVRWIFPGAKGDDGSYIPGFARALAQKAGVKTQDRQIPIVWHGAPRFRKPCPLRNIRRRCRAFCRQAGLKDKIVLIGSDLSLTDRHRTPFDVVDPYQMAGVFIQAHALSQLLHGALFARCGMAGQSSDRVFLRGSGRAAGGD